MKKTFNLSEFRKQAYYDDGKGLMQRQTRSCQNCYKAKVDKGTSPQKAWSECLSEYQKMNNNDWATKYASKSNNLNIKYSQAEGLKVPLFTSVESAKEIANSINQSWSHRSNGAPHVMMAKRGNGYVLRPNFDYFTGENSPVWQTLVKDSLAAGATLVPWEFKG